jgi:NADPH2:quinone reductase
MHSLLMSQPSPGSDSTSVVTCPDPRPGPGQVSIDVARAGINFVDVMARRGDGGYSSTWPYAPGLEASGRIREIGPGVIGFSVGQRVAALTRGGALAEIAVADAELTAILPPSVPWAQAAAAPLMLATAWLLLSDVARIRPGESVLMHSASGGLGSAVAQLVPVLGGGLRIGTVGRPERIADALAVGWDVAFGRDADLAASVLEKTPSGVDIVLDPAGTALLDLDLAVAGPGARVVLLGNAFGGVPEPLPPLGRLMAGNVSLAGFSISQLSRSAPGRVAEALKRVIGLLDSGELTVAVTEVDGLDAVAGVHDLLATGRGVGKYVVRIGE